MTKASKKVIIVIASVVVLAGLGFFVLSRSIYNQRTCEWANIDNIELHTGIDIPEVKACDCEYQQEQNTKSAYFDINKNKVDIDKYIQTNNFKKLDSTAGVSFDYLAKTGTNIEELRRSSELYYTNGSYKGETWQVLLDNSSGRLWVAINYNN